MASTELELRVESLEQFKADILSKSTQPKDGTQATTVDNAALIPIQNPNEPVTFVEALTFIKGMLSVLGFTDINQDPPVGAYYFGEKSGIKGGRFTIGKIINQSPAVSDAHVNVFYEYFE